MLRDFGAVTVIDLTVSLLGVLVVLPAVLVLAERRGERAAVRLPAVRRGGRGAGAAAPPVGRRRHEPTARGSGPARASTPDADGREAEARGGERYAHRRDPDLAAYGIGPDRPPAPPRMAPGTSRYTWFVGVVAVLVIAYVSVNSLRTQGPGSRGVQAGAVAPPFAAPLATGDLAGRRERRPPHGAG